MGGCYSKQKLTSQSMLVQIKRLRHHAQYQSDKELKQAEILESKLLASFRQPQHLRNRPSEEHVITETVNKHNRIYVFNFIKNQCDKLSSYSHDFDHPKRREQTIDPVFSLLLYVEPILNDQELNNECMNIRRSYPSVKEATDVAVGDEVLIYSKYRKQPSEKMKNQFVLEFCSRKNVSLDVLKSMGHEYRYGL